MKTINSRWKQLKLETTHTYTMKETTPRYVIIKLLKTSDMASRFKKTSYVQGTKVRVTPSLGAVNVKTVSN